MSSRRILIVGGVAGGASAATRARRMNEKAEIVIFEKGPDVSFANCGLPYHIGGQIAERDKLLVSTPQAFKDMFNIEVRCGHEVLGIDRSRHQVEVLDHVTGQRSQEKYDKLILAPGAKPIIPPWDGVTSPNVFTLRDMTDMDRIKSRVDRQSGARAVVIGAGYIGLEMVESFTQRGWNVTLVEKEPQILPIMDPEMVRPLIDTLTGQGIVLHMGAAVDNLQVRDGQVHAVRLGDGTEIPADLVLICIGVRPDVQLAAAASLKIGSSGAIAVNEYLQTSDPDIYAVGDAAEVIHQVTGKPVNLPLAGPANRNGRLAGEHAATDRCASATPVAGTAIVGLFGKAAGLTGLSATAAQRLGIEHEVSYAIRGHHAGYYPGAEQMILKLVYDPKTGRVLGGQAVGGAGVDKRIDVIATAIRFNGTVDDLSGVDLAYAPQFGSAKDPLHIAAFVACNQMGGLIRQIPPGGRPIGQLIDVRGPAMHAAGALPGAINIPLPKLRESLMQLNRNEPVTVHCQVGQTSYIAARILIQSGFKEVHNLAGGYTMNKSTG
ncbi:MAG: FAD-dependent oxidoreductase [Phycisphaerales bacterium]|nr:FAD-dependent oxidoreductase [Phycisphaerales bacterium]